MAVAVDAVSSAETASGAGVTTATHTNLTIGASLSNGALIFGVGWDAKVTSPNAHWDSAGTNQLMTLIGTVNTAGTNGTVAIFGLRNPTSGNKTFSTSWTGASLATIFGVSFTGVDQTSDANAFKNFNSATGNSTTPSVTITSATGNIIVGAFVNSDNTVDWTSVNNTTLCVTLGLQLAMNRAAGAASVAMSGVLTATDQWVATGVNVAAATGGVTDLRNFWYSPWQTPVFNPKAKFDSDQQFLSWSGFTPVVTPTSGAASAGIVGPVFPWQLVYPNSAQPLPAKEDIPRQEWTIIWDEPVWTKRGLPAHQQQFLTQSLFPVAVVVTPYAGWDDTLEWPRLPAPRSPVYSAPFLAFTQVQAATPLNVGWMFQWDIPIRREVMPPPDESYEPVLVVQTGIGDMWYPAWSSRRRRIIAIGIG